MLKSNSKIKPIVKLTLFQKIFLFFVLIEIIFLHEEYFYTKDNLLVKIRLSKLLIWKDAIKKYYGFHQHLSGLPQVSEVKNPKMPKISRTLLFNAQLCYNFEKSVGSDVSTDPVVSEPMAFMNIYLMEIWQIVYKIPYYIKTHICISKGILGSELLTCLPIFRYYIKELKYITLGPFFNMICKIIKVQRLSWPRSYVEMARA